MQRCSNTNSPHNGCCRPAPASVPMTSAAPSKALTRPHRAGRAGRRAAPDASTRVRAPLRVPALPTWPPVLSRDRASPSGPRAPLVRSATRPTRPLRRVLNVVKDVPGKLKSRGSRCRSNYFCSEQEMTSHHSRTHSLGPLWPDLRQKSPRGGKASRCPRPTGPRPARSPATARRHGQSGRPARVDAGGTRCRPQAGLLTECDGEPVTPIPGLPPPAPSPGAARG